MEDIRLRIGHVPTEREVGHDLQSFIFLHERIEKQDCHALRGCVLAHTRIEIFRWLVQSNRHDSRIRRRLARTSWNEGSGENEKEKPIGSGHSPDYAVTCRAAVSTTALRSFSTWRLILALR